MDDAFWGVITLALLGVLLSLLAMMVFDDAQRVFAGRGRRLE